jgi:hypothetical protein
LFKRCVCGSLYCLVSTCSSAVYAVLFTVLLVVVQALCIQYKEPHTQRLNNY